MAEYEECSESTGEHMMMLQPRRRSVDDNLRAALCHVVRRSANLVEVRRTFVH
jgi:hypothetical protein